jgi:rubredoxin
MPTRYRCTACGNLTRFDVTSNRRTRAFHHYSVGGELEVEDTEVLAETIEEVACRWCGTGKDVVELTDADLAEGSTADADQAPVEG